MTPYLHVSNEAFEIIRDGLDNIIEKVSSMKISSEEISVEANELDTQCQPLGNPRISEMKAPKKSSTKESRNGCFKSGIETTGKRKCSTCGESVYNFRTCEQRKST